MEVSIAPNVKPYGKWDSPITSEMVSAGTKRLGDTVIDGAIIYWSESRPTEGGRYAIYRRLENGTTEEILPRQYSARTRVHEYGGGAYAVRNGIMYFTNFEDQRLYRLENGTATALTAAGVRFADMRITDHGVIAVAEDHTSQGLPENYLALIDPKTGAVTRLHSGRDFYAAPAVDSQEERLAWICWDHPNMPWDATELWVADLKNGRLENSQCIRGNSYESVFQPGWSPDGQLFYVADATGWWNFYQWNGKRHFTLCPQEAEFGLPHWLFGASTWGFVNGKIVCAYCIGGDWTLGVLHPESGALFPLEVDGTDFSGLRTGPGFVVCYRGSPTAADQLIKINPENSRVEILAKSPEPEVDPAVYSLPKKLDYKSGNRTAHAYYYPPKNPAFRGPEGALPPLVVMTHGGPTTAVRSTFKLMVQFWTSRGFAVLDVNYGGSTGYGRLYREYLKGNWGVVDREDCEAAARYLVKQKLADPRHLAIRGGSAGGFTTLCALTFGELFTVGASYYGVSDCTLLAQETHKFESRYSDKLIAPLSTGRAVYEERSPSRHVDKLNCPVIFFQGDEDKVVLPNQSEIMYEALKAKGIRTEYVLYKGEQHGFRKAETLKDSLEKELAFYLEVFGI